MSRTAWILIILTVSIIGLGVGEMVYINKSADNLMGAIEDLETKVERGNWREASQQLSDLDKVWESTRDRWSLFLHHSELDELSMCLARTQGFLKARDRMNLIMEVVTMKALVEHIPEMEHVNLSTIF